MYFIKIFILCFIIFYAKPSFALETFNGYTSWYGPWFHTRTTANGEQYDMYGISAAHKTLPFETLIRITHLENKRSTVIRINDRGPVAPILITDLSHGAAMGLDMVEEGKAYVQFEIVGNKKGLLTKGESFFLNLDDSLTVENKDLAKDKLINQSAYFQEVLNSIHAQNKIKKNLTKLYAVGLNKATELLVEVDNNLCLGPFENFLEAEKLYSKLATIYPHASIWLKPSAKARKLILY